MRIPDNNRWTQTNESYLSGVLHSTHNMYINSAGKLELAPRTSSIINSGSTENFGYIQSIKYFNDAYVVVTDENCFSFDLKGSNTGSSIASSPSTSQYTDAEVLNNRLYVTLNTSFSYWDGSSWTNGLGALTTGYPHPITIFDSLVTYKLAIGNNNQVKTYETSTHTVNSTVLTIPSQYVITCLEYRNGYLYVGTRNIVGNEAKVFMWNGSGTSAQYEIPMGSGWVYALTPYESTVAAITDSGELSYLSGSRKIKLAALPVFYNNEARWQVDSTPTFGKVNFNGLKANKNSLYINVNGVLDKGIMPEMKSGIWEFNPNTGLNHKYSFSSDTVVYDNGLSASGTVITTSSTHNLKTGDTAVFSAISGLSGVDIRVLYYVSVQSATTIKLAVTRDDLEKGNFVSITGTPTTGDVLVYTPNTEYYAYSCTTGAISLTTFNEEQLKCWSGELLFGARIENKDGDANYSLHIPVIGNNTGSFKIQRIFSSANSDNWQGINIAIDDILDSELIIVRGVTSRKKPRKAKMLHGVWASSTEINLDSLFSDESDWRSVVVEDLVTVIDEYGRGKSAQIVDIDSTSPTIVLTLDSEIGTAFKKATFLVEPSSKQTSFTGDDYDDGQLEGRGFDLSGRWYEINIELQGDRLSIPFIDVINQTKEKNGGK